METFDVANGNACRESMAKQCVNESKCSFMIQNSKHLLFGCRQRQR